MRLCNRFCTLLTYLVWSLVRKRQSSSLERSHLDAKRTWKTLRSYRLSSESTMMSSTRYVPQCWVRNAFAPAAAPTAAMQTQTGNRSKHWPRAASNYEMHWRRDS